jgi:P pilus assembly chaperone PapD
MRWPHVFRPRALSRALLANVLSAAALSALCLAPRMAAAQAVLVAPTAIVIDARTPSAPVTLVNTGDRPAEVVLSSAFGVPVTDSTGAMRLAMDGLDTDTLPSAVSFLRVYPSRLVLAPGERRVVRVIADAPAGLPAREHWARLVVTSRSAAAITTTAGAANDSTTSSNDAASATAAGDASIALDLVVRSVLAVFWRPPTVTTGLTMNDVRAHVLGGALECRVRLERQGTAAFVGSVRALLRDSSGVVRVESQLPLGVYASLDPALRLDIGRLVAGTYTLELEAATRRPDVPASVIVAARPVRTVMRVQLR